MRSIWSTRSTRSTGHYRRLCYCLALLALPCAPLHSQVGNLGKFDSRLLHWGIQVGFTNSKFDLEYSQDEELREVLQGSTSYFSPGFHIAVIGDLRLNNWFNLRILPGVTIITREVTFSWEKDYYQTHRLTELSRNVESVYGDLPIELKFRSMRYGNFRPYLTAGISYGFDFASLRKNRNRTDQSIIRLEPHDFRYSMGVGFDVFLVYVKFALELKMTFGLIDLKVDDTDIYTRSFDNLSSRTFMLSFTFEG